MLTFSLLGGNLGAITRTFDPGALVATNILTAPGTCSADQAFIWKIATDGSGYWARRAINEPCVAVSSQVGPEIRVHAPGEGGGVSVDTIKSYRTLKYLNWRLLMDKTRTAITEQIALAPQLPSCPESSGGGATDCYVKGPSPSVKTMTLPPGSFEFWDVVFHVSELAGGRFDKQFVPDVDQRALIDFEVLRLSMDALGYLDDTATSILHAMQTNSDLRIKINGWSMNPPVEPTAEEWNTVGGYQKWRARGGYPIHYGIATGRSPALDHQAGGVSIPVCASIKCACPRDNAAFDGWRAPLYRPGDPPVPELIAPDQEIHVMPRCIGAVINKDGIQTGTTDNAGTWIPYIAVASSSGTEAVPGGVLAGRDAPVADPLYRISIIYKDQSSLQAFGEKMAKMMTALGNMFCKNPAPIKDELKKTNAEKCVDKSQKTCAKGEPGCSCTQPPTSVKAGYVLFDAWATHWCGEWTKEHAETAYEPPTPKTPPELKAKPKKWPYFLAAGIAVFGAFAIVKTTRQRRLRA